MLLCERCKGVAEAEVRPLTCSVLGSGSCAVCKERATIRQKIKQLEAEIIKLRAKHDALATSMNAMHDPFIHKLPPEIGSHIFHLSLPKVDVRDPWDEGSELVAGALRLGAVCCKWRQLAWATPNLWGILYINIQPSMSLFLAESLPDLLREWLRRSGMLPLTILFSYSVEDYSEYEFSDDDPQATIDTLENTKALVVEILNLHSGRWRNLHLHTDADIFQHFSGSVQPKQLVDLELSDNSLRRPGSMSQFKMKSNPNPTHLKLISFPLKSVNIGWESLTHATLFCASTKESVDLLRQAPGLEYYHVSAYEDDFPGFDFGTHILHPRLHSLHLSRFDMHTFLETVTLPSLEEWTQNLRSRPVPLTTALSFLERSRCRLKVLNLDAIPCPSENLNTLLQAIPSLERLRLSFRSGFSDNIILDGILARIFCSAPAAGNISESVADTTTESLLPYLQFMDVVVADSAVAPFSWDRIPQLYHQSHRQSLTFKSAAQRSQITYETACQLLKLVDEGFDLQIVDDTMDGDFLENFRNRMHYTAEFWSKH